MISCRINKEKIVGSRFFVSPYSVVGVVKEDYRDSRTSDEQKSVYELTLLLAEGIRQCVTYEDQAQRDADYDLLIASV